MADEQEAVRRSDDAPGFEPAPEPRIGGRSSHALMHDHQARQRLLRIRITDVETGQVIVALRLPGGLLGVAERLGARLAPRGTSIASLASLLGDTATGTPLVVEDRENGERVEITVEG